MGPKEEREIILKDRFNAEEQRNYERFIEALAQVVMALQEEEQYTAEEKEFK